MHLTKYLHQQGSRVLLDEAILSTYTLRYFLSHREERQVVKPMKIHKIVKKNKFKTFPRLPDFAYYVIFSFDGLFSIDASRAF